MCTRFLGRVQSSLSAPSRAFSLAAYYHVLLLFPTGTDLSCRLLGVLLLPTGVTLTAVLVTPSALLPTLLTPTGLLVVPGRSLDAAWTPRIGLWPDFLMRPSWPARDAWTPDYTPCCCCSLDAAGGVVGQASHTGVLLVTCYRTCSRDCSEAVCRRGVTCHLGDHTVRRYDAQWVE